jgi:hypothetical protein
VLALLLIGFSLASFPPLAVTGGVMLLFALGFYYLSRRPHLDLSQEGIGLYQNGFRLETGWDNVESLSVPNAGFVLRQPLATNSANRLRRFRNTGIGAPMYSPQQVALIEQNRFIPLEPWAYLLKKDSFREELARYAPWLSGQLGSP